MRGRHTEGLTLIEALASVVVLGVFLTVLLALVDGVHTQSSLDLEKRTATALAEEALARMSESGAQTVIQQGPYTREVGGVRYTITPSVADQPPPYAQPISQDGQGASHSVWDWLPDWLLQLLPQWLRDLLEKLFSGSGSQTPVQPVPQPVAAEVTVTWNTSVMHQPIRECITLTQLFPY
jgi:type II secretory pathway pseudopilin PulG